MSQEVMNLLTAQRTPILDRWRARVADLTAAMHISRIELLDHMPGFVDGLIALFGSRGNGTEAGEALAQEVAPLHGAQRLNIGFDVDEVVREYGILADVLIDVTSAAGISLDTADVRRLVSAVNAGAAEAVREYVRRRDEELVREQAKHRAFVAHELRTPLSTALAASSLLAHAHPTLGEGRPMQLLGRSLGQVRDLIDQVLVAGRLDAGVEPDRIDVDLAAMVRDLEDTLRPEADSRRVEILLDVPTSLHVQADVRLLYSAISNLFRNGVKYTKPGTTVRVSLHEAEAFAVFEVVDRCGTITANNWATIFEPYTRGDDAAVRQRDGLGLGLAIAKQAAEAHGGTLSVHNVDADGCVFELRIPRGAPPTP